MMALMPGTLSPLVGGRSERSNYPARRIGLNGTRSLEPAACPTLRWRPCEKLAYFAKKKHLL